MKAKQIDPKKDVGIDQTDEDDKRDDGHEDDQETGNQQPAGGL